MTWLRPSTAATHAQPFAGAVLTVVPARLTMDGTAQWARVAVPEAVWAATHAACGATAGGGGVEGGEDVPRQQWFRIFEEFQHCPHRG